MAEVEQGSKPPSDEQLKNMIEFFRTRLSELKYMERELLKNRIAGDYYIGRNMVQTYLPDKVIFKRHTTETF